MFSNCRDSDGEFFNGAVINFMFCGVIGEKSDVKRLYIFNNYTCEKRYYFISESEKMIYFYYIPEEYHPRLYKKSIPQN